MAQAVRQSIISSNLWVLEYLLEQDKVEDELIKHFYDGFLCDVGELPPPIQVRLMLRVLRDNVANITQSSLDALNCLTNFSHESPDLYPPACRVEDLSPALELYVQVQLSLCILGHSRTGSGQRLRYLVVDRSRQILSYVVSERLVVCCWDQQSCPTMLWWTNFSLSHRARAKALLWSFTGISLTAKPAVAWCCTTTTPR